MAFTSNALSGTRRGCRSSFILSPETPNRTQPLLPDPRVVVMNPAIFVRPRPVIAGTGIPVSSIYERYKAGDSVADLVRDFRLETSAIEEAIRCEAA